MSKSIQLTLLALILLVPGSVIQSQATTSDFNIFVINGGVHDLNLRAIQEADGDVELEEDFVIDPEDVVQVHKDTSLLITATNDGIERVKLIDAAKQTIELKEDGNNHYSLNGIPRGIYILDIITNIPDSFDKGLYETILVVLEPSQQGVSVERIFTTVKTFFEIDIDTRDNDEEDNLREICAFLPSDPRCDPDEEGNCPDGFGTNEDGQCFPLGDCPDGYHRANDDESGACIPERDLKQCEDGSWAEEDQRCPEDFEEVPPVEEEPPIEEVPEEETPDEEVPEEEEPSEEEGSEEEPSDDFNEIEPESAPEESDVE